LQLANSDEIQGSFLIQTPEGNIYFAGDTAYGDHFERIYEQFGPIRLALLLIGAYKPSWFMWREHMDPEEAVRAHLDLHSSASIAIHFDTFNLAEDGFDEPVTDLHAAMRHHTQSSESVQRVSPVAFVFFFCIRHRVN
jgi:L-ascorbate metabolism protein UlaG (beta-lactamase superfamily)